MPYRQQMDLQIKIQNAQLKDIPVMLLLLLRLPLGARRDARARRVARPNVAATAAVGWWVG